MCIRDRPSKAATFQIRGTNSINSGKSPLFILDLSLIHILWLGTDNGLYSYDGYHGYRHFQEHAFSNTRVNALGFEGRMPLPVAR